jgi:hypothetical protein
MPQLPLAPEHLVTSAKKIRREERPVERTGQLGHPVQSAEVRLRLEREARAQKRAEAQVRAQAHRVRISAGCVRRLARDCETEWYATRKEWERAELIEHERVEVPENLPLGVGPATFIGHLYA